MRHTFTDVFHHALPRFALNSVDVASRQPGPCFRCEPYISYLCGLAVRLSTSRANDVPTSSCPASSPLLLPTSIERKFAEAQKHQSDALIKAINYMRHMLDLANKRPPPEAGHCICSGGHRNILLPMLLASQSSPLRWPYPPPPLPFSTPPPPPCRSKIVCWTASEPSCM